MELIFLPLTILFVKWRMLSRLDWGFTIYFLTYAIVLVYYSELPLGSYIGGFYVGIPSVSYFFYIFPYIQTHHPECFVKVMSFLGLSIAFACLLVI